MTFAMFFFNADRTLYGRYGTKHARDLTLEGLKSALRGALEMHRRPPTPAPRPAPAWKTPELMPTLATRHRKGDISSYGCIHCHSVNEGEVTSRWRLGETIPDRLLWKHPLPNVLGLAVDPKDGRTVQRSTAAGLQPGDRLAAVEGRPILSVADVSAALHEAPETGTLRIRKEGGPEVGIPLAAGWRRRLPFARNNTTAMMQMTTAGFFCEAMPAGDRAKRGLPDTALALRVTYMPNATDPDPNLNAAKAGLRVGDVIVGVDGHAGRWSVDDWLAYLFQKKKPGETLELKILRAGETRSIAVPLPGVLSK
ncbi:MAG TPA: PDZ domain-containing protein [Planctomycetota bacterium]|nr:PDZ domain-containing protein [Planctomycetota bacterium]